MEHHENSDWDECDVSEQHACKTSTSKGCVFWRWHDLFAVVSRDGQIKVNPVLSVSFSLLILTVMNLGLFFKLWAMEDIAHRMYLSTKHRLRERSEARSENFSVPLQHAYLNISFSNDVSRCHDHSQSRSLCVGGEGKGVSLPSPFCLCC